MDFFPNEVKWQILLQASPDTLTSLSLTPGYYSLLSDLSFWRARFLQDKLPPALLREKLESFAFYYYLYEELRSLLPKVEAIIADSRVDQMLWIDLRNIPENILPLPGIPKEPIIEGLAKQAEELAEAEKMAQKYEELLGEIATLSSRVQRCVNITPDWDIGRLIDWKAFFARGQKCRVQTDNPLCLGIHINKEGQLHYTINRDDNDLTSIEEPFTLQDYHSLLIILLACQIPYYQHNANYPERVTLV